MSGDDPKLDYQAPIRRRRPLRDFIVGALVWIAWVFSVMCLLMGGAALWDGPETAFGWEGVLFIEETAEKVMWTVASAAVAITLLWVIHWRSKSGAKAVELEDDPRFIKRIADAREQLRAGKGVRIEDLK